MATEDMKAPEDSHPRDSRPDDAARRRFLATGTAVVGAVGAGVASIPFIKSWNPGTQARLAGAPVVADIRELREGQRLTLEWRGQPVWVIRRSGAVLEALVGLEDRLRDPRSANADQQPAYISGATRSLRPDILVLVGLCTHLGCVPEMAAEIRPEPYDPQWQGGFFCPCHKSRFDMAGRVFRGMPAPSNLVVPPHHYADEHTLVIGVDPQADAQGVG